MLISIIIPTLNRANSLKRTLGSIRNQDFQQNFEVIVVDNGSTDETALIKEFLEQHFKDSQYHFNQNPGLLSCRHLGANQAKGDVLVYFDDDVEINPSYLKNIYELFLDEQVKLATGPCLPTYEIAAPTWLDGLWTTTAQGKYFGSLSLMDFGNTKIEIDPNFVWGLNFCIRKSTLFDLEGFHPDTMPPAMQCFQGDGETGLTIKAIKKGIKAYYHPGLTLNHHIPESRLTKSYMIKRAYFQGVCNSFTSIREKHFDVNETIEQPAKVGNLKKLRNALHPYYRWLKPVLKIDKPSEVSELQIAMQDAEKEGFNFHQKCFESNEQVKNWVLKKNYLDVP